MPSYFESGFSRSPEETTRVQLKIEGKLPSWLKITLFRNGPGTFEVNGERYRHWFDGLAMLHKFVIEDGAVFYTNRFLSCDAYKLAMQSKRIRYSEFATDPHRSVMGKLFAVFDQRIIARSSGKPRNQRPHNALLNC
ncbi:hypothetical protein GF407_13980 [candidate division KSB1 bacterium]|nr:hypothetical protein [candidate division KSB1 bacterium]